MRHEVTEAHTATAVGSGDVPVLATPWLITWMEAATVRAAAPFVTAGLTTVGTGVRIRHLHATPVGGRVDVLADPPAETEGRQLTFRVRAVDGSGQLVATGEIDRAIVDRRRFLAGASAQE
ncbi:thioesterase [Streptomyces antnestii]|uniref:Thioesterase n=1 Tax=Streptomyces antnestii TaxID=2494256 RepID=A0A3S2YRW1_9ACTN|nr:thioesterase [Streptomyces sp. San01]RVU17654.1 thioesterase [Streptomyces sp. San01]